MQLDPFLFRKLVIRDHVMGHLSFDVVYVTPAIGAPVFEKKDAGRDVWRLMLDVRHLGDFPILRVENLYSVV